MTEEPTEAELNEVINRYVPGFRWKLAKFEIHPSALRSILASLIVKNRNLENQIICLEETISGMTYMPEDAPNGDQGY